jgi:hypothetical protein
VCWTYLNCASFSRTKTSTLCLRRVYSASEHAILFSTQPSSAFGNTCGNGSTDYSTKQVRYRHTTFDFSNTIFSLVDVNAKPSLDHGTGSFLPGDRRSTKGRPIASALPVRQKPHPPSASPPGKPPLPDKTEQNIKPLPYKPKIRPTKGYDVCDYEGLTCLAETSPGDVPELPRLAVDSVSKRSSARDPAKIDFGPEILTLISKPYWTSGELFDDKKNGGLNLKEAWIDFAKDSMSDYKVQFFNKKPPQFSSSELKHRYITEHIVEVRLPS